MRPNLSKEETIREHRKMWNWIADETLKQETTICKRDYFDHIQTPINERPINECFCCQYVQNIKPSYFSVYRCRLYCPVEWPDGKACLRDIDQLYNKWTSLISSERYIEAADLARQIANLPERSDD